MMKQVKATAMVVALAASWQPATADNAVGNPALWSGTAATDSAYFAQANAAVGDGDEGPHFSVSRLRYPYGDGLGVHYGEQDIVDASWRVMGNSLTNGTGWPRIDLGLTYQQNRYVPGTGMGPAETADEADPFVRASRTWRNAGGMSGWVNTTLRYRQPTRFGLIGDSTLHHDGSCTFCFETSAGFLSHDFMTGIELSHRPNLVNGYQDTTTFDAYVAWVFSRRMSLTGAYVNYGDVAGHANIAGPYLSIRYDLWR